MIAGIRKKIDRAWFDFRCSGIFDTPPVKCDPDSGILIVSQLHHPDMTMYMLAMKSFARFVRPQGFVIVDDGLLPEDRRILSGHFDPIRFVPSEGVTLGACPAGGCWERLLTLSLENRDHYVIQLDADTLTLSEPAEVLQCLAQNRSFTLGTSTGRQAVGFGEASRFAHESTNNHVQNHAERALASYPGHEHLKYVRGCAGFTGFARGQLLPEKIQEFSAQMGKLVGKEKWREWGSEQVASNYMAANAPDSLVLPVERYPFWRPDVDIAKAVFVHFFGVFRFMGGMYTRQALRVIRQLSS
ncbi:MAG: hypothetical protein EPN14_01820 [Gallionella sp.]|nr:MAG: hypothetical protein EPN14_01820 [Gallionella sp.]